MLLAFLGSSYYNGLMINERKTLAIESFAFTTLFL